MPLTSTNFGVVWLNILSGLAPVLSALISPKNLFSFQVFRPVARFWSLYSSINSIIPFA